MSSLTTNSSSGNNGQILSSTGNGLSWINNYSLPTASNSTGGVKIGTNLSIDQNGILSSTDTYTITDGQLSKNNFTDDLKAKLDGIADSANNVVYQQQVVVY